MFLDSNAEKKTTNTKLTISTDKMNESSNSESNNSRENEMAKERVQIFNLIITRLMEHWTNFASVAEIGKIFPAIEITHRIELQGGCVIVLVSENLDKETKRIAKL